MEEQEEGDWGGVVQYTDPFIICVKGGRRVLAKAGEQQRWERIGLD